MGQNVIELNGKRYDALTGSLLGESSSPVKPKTHVAPASHRGRFVDGVIASPKKVNTNTSQRAPFIPVKAEPTKVRKSKTRGTKHVAAHKPEHAKTLMRSAVKKPNIEKKQAIKVQTPAELTAKPAGAIVPKLSVTHIDARRLEHAKDVKQSQAIKKFSPSPRQTTPVARRPVATPVRDHNATQSANAHAVIQQHPAGSLTTVSSPTHEEDIFEKALARANSHEQPKPHHHARRKQRGRRRLVNVLAGVAAVLVIGGFIAYLNAPNIELRIASVRAGFHAAIPGYQPLGYAMSRDVQTHNKQVSISFHSNNGSSFKLTQQPSNWDSATLYDNMIAATNKPHQTLQSNGRTIYLFDDTSAAWVNNGVLYQITGEAALNNYQIKQLVASI